MVLVLIPVPVIQLDKPHPRLQKTAGQEALPAEVRGFAPPGLIGFSDLITIEGGLGFAA
jgi:hypothetical protein